jgi:large subunit ribosomal protein L28
MAKVCQITGKSTKMAGSYSNRVRATKFNKSRNPKTGATKTRKKANLQKKRIFVPEMNKSVRITVSTKGLKTIQKKGAYSTLKKAGII